MDRLTKKDLLALLEFIRESYDICDLDTFARRLISRLPKIVSSEITSYNEVNPRRRRITWVAEPSGVLSFHNSNQIFEHHISEHPLITHYQRTRDGRALRISDFLTKTQFHRLALYNEFYRRVDVEHQMAFTLPTPPPHIIGIALNRGRPDFTERDRTVLNLLGPHLAQAYRNAEAVTRMQQELALLRQAMDKLDRGVIALTRDGRVRLATDRAVRWVAEYFGRRSLQANRLPEALQRWLKHQEALLEVKDDVPPPPKPLVLEREAKRLVVRHLCEQAQCLLLLEEQPTALQPQLLEPFGLSRREAEVLCWLAPGKTNAEIGMILGLSGRTVQKHLEHIYQKLGVETRTAAAAKAYEIASIPSPSPSPRGRGIM